MDTDTDDRFWDALARWEELYQQGTDAPPEDLCRSHPENTERLKQHIQALKRMSWLTKPATEEAEFAPPQGGSDQPPRRLGEYDLLEPIGVGGMGQVFKALHRRMDRVVAVKILPRVSADSARRFQDEVRAAGKLLHPNIVTSFDAGEQDGVPFLAMEFIDGIDLAQQVQKHGPVSIKMAVDFTVQAARGLEYAHSKGVIHRDVKPSNLFLSKGGILKILDLGLAQLNGDKGTIAGTSDYLPPESVETGQADHRGDIYSLGCTLFFLLTGKPPFTGKTVIQTVMAHCEQPTPSLKTARSDVSAALDAVFQRMVAKRPQDRYQSMAEVIPALERCLRRRRAKWMVFAGLVGGSSLQQGYSAS